MKNQGFIRNRVIPLGDHKDPEPEALVGQRYAGQGVSTGTEAGSDVPSAKVQAEDTEPVAPSRRRGPKAKGDAGRPATLGQDERTKRYTLVLKVDAELASRAFSEVGGGRSTIKRAIITELRTRLIEGAGKATPHTTDKPVTVRVDLRLPEDLVSKIVEAERTNPFEAPSTVLGRFVSGYYAQMLRALPKH